MSETQQPQWKCVGGLGDVDPIAYGGGFVYVDQTGVYAPEVTWFEPAADEEWHKTEGATPVTIYCFTLERDSSQQWWFSELDSVAASSGQDVATYRAELDTHEPMKVARVYEEVIGYFGPFEFDQYPISMTEDEAYARYAEEMKLAREVRTK